ncbi:hypothetical protein OK006_10354 [Actinobacteria bacterium OK006]|nr:hypothetical protein OK006_10354 [Actinobacteria bacterium OK006]
MTQAQLAAVAFNTARNQALEELTGLVGRVQACAALGVSRATYYRQHRRSPAPPKPRRERRRHARALTPEEEIRILDVLHSPEFACRRRLNPGSVKISVKSISESSGS